MICMIFDVVAAISIVGIFYVYFIKPQNKRKCPWQRINKNELNKTTIKACDILLDCVEKLNIEYFIGFGTELQAYRDGIIDYKDHDLDIMVPLWLNKPIFGCNEYKPVNPKKWNNTSIKLTDKYQICNNNFKHYQKMFENYIRSRNITNIRGVANYWDNIHIYLDGLIGKHYLDTWLMVSNEYAYRDINICECEFCGRMVKCMKNPMPSILMFYGSDWKIPKSIENGIEKSASDSRSYKTITLKNDLKVLMISHPDCDTATAAMSVGNGSNSDPDNLLGISHLLEHMLFLGTKDFPEENSFSKFLDEHGGYSNAYTSSEETVYYFNVNPPFLKEGLEQFSSYFICPLFNPECLTREINVVNSEYEKNNQSDAFRRHEVFRSLLKKSSPFSQFSCGNLDTLVKYPQKHNIDIRDEVIKHYNQFYSSNIMRLAVIGKDPLEKIEEYVQQYFSKIENKKIDRIEADGDIFDNLLKKRLIYIPVKASRKVILSFPFPSVNTTDSEVLSHRYYSHLIGHESDGSILHLLREKCWALGLSAGIGHNYIKWSSFDISVDLSEEGLNHINEIIYIIFQYIELVKNNVEKWIWEENSKMNGTTFKYKSISNNPSYAYGLSNKMFYSSLDKILTFGHLPEKYDENSIKEMGKYFNINNMFINIITQEYEKLGLKLEDFQIEPINKGQYYINSIDNELLKKCDKPESNPALHLPVKNPFIPEDFTLHNELNTDCFTSPKMMFNDERMRIWFKQDCSYKLPKIIIDIGIHLPLFYYNPKDIVLCNIYLKCLKHIFSSESYYCEVAGLGMELTTDAYGPSLSIMGFNDKVVVLLEKTLELLKITDIKEEIYNTMKDKVLKLYESELKSMPFRRMSSIIMRATNYQSPNVQTKLSLLSTVTYDDLLNFSKTMLKTSFLECFIIGNYTEDNVKVIEKLITDKFSKITSTPLSPALMVQKRHVMLEKKEECVFNYLCENPDENNYCTIDLFTPKITAMCQCIENILSQSCYSELRTKKQLGYVVWFTFYYSDGVTGIRILVQSDKKPPEEVTVDIKTYMKDVAMKLIEELSDEEFKTVKESLITEKTKKIVNLMNEHDEHYAAIKSKLYNFDRKKEQVKELEKLTKEELIDFYKKYFDENSDEYKYVNFRMYCVGKPHPEGIDNIVKTYNEFQANHSLYPSKAKVYFE